MICPICEKDIEISARDVKLAISHKKETGGKVLVSCSECHRVMVLPEPVPEDLSEVESWMPSVDGCCCVPLLNDDDVRLPTGCFSQAGKTVYRPGGGGPVLMKRPYMFAYGIDPETAWAATGSKKETFHIGGT